MLFNITCSIISSGMTIYTQSNNMCKSAVATDDTVGTDRVMFKQPTAVHDWLSTAMHVSVQLTAWYVYCKSVTLFMISVDHV